MSAFIKQLTQEAGFRLKGDEIHVPLGERGHIVYVEDLGGNAFRIWAIAAPKRIVDALPDIDNAVLRWNRQSDLVDFCIDGRSRLIGSCAIPRVGIDGGEWKIYINALAQACDRLEWLLTGKDEH
jgi:hypothetical protein